MRRIEPAVWLMLWEALAPLFGEWLDGLVRRTLQRRGMKKIPG